LFSLITVGDDGFELEGDDDSVEVEETRGKLVLVRALYVLMQLVGLGLGVWKVNQMGLLPTTRSDWLAWETARTPLERAIPAF